MGSLLKKLYNLCLEGEAGFVSRLIMEIVGVTVWLKGIVNILTKSPDPPRGGPYTLNLAALLAELFSALAEEANSKP